MKMLLLCTLAFAAPRLADEVVIVFAPAPVLFDEGDAGPNPTNGHKCKLQLALSADSCNGSADCFVGLAENCQLPPGWNGASYDKCVCP